MNSYSLEGKSGGFFEFVRKQAEETMSVNECFENIEQYHTCLFPDALSVIRYIISLKNLLHFRFVHQRHNLFALWGRTFE